MRRNKLLLSSLLVVLATGVAVVAAMARGSWADDERRDPAGVGDGPLAQVLRLPDGSRQVRASIRLAQPPDVVWQAITDYDHYGDICSFIHGAQVEHGPDGCRVCGNAVTPVPLSLPFTIELKHQQDLLEYTSSWDEPSGDVLVNRGAWQVRPAGDGESLLSLSLEVQVRCVPTWLLRNISRQRLGDVLRAVEQRLMEGRPSGKPW
jgi:hypothetical protein